MTVEISAIFTKGLLSARPAAGSNGAHYFATDTGLWYRDNGASWDTLGPNQIPGQLALMGRISPAQIAANTDNWNPTGLASAAVIRASTDASRNLTGLVGGSDGRVVLLGNVGAFDLVLKHDATSTAANRFYCPNNADKTLNQNASAWLMYDTTSSRWRVVG